MKNELLRFKTSTFELRQVKCLTVTSMLVALSIILGYLSFMPTPSIRISFVYLPVAIMGFLYGPVVSICGAGTIDLINYILNPMGGFNPGITLCALITGLIYGIFLYQKKINWPRVAIAFFTNALISNWLLKSFFLAVLMGTSWSAQLITRLPAQIVMLVIESVVFMTIYPKIRVLKNK